MNVNSGSCSYSHFELVGDPWKVTMERFCVAYDGTTAEVRLAKTQSLDFPVVFISVQLCARMHRRRC